MTRFPLAAATLALVCLALAPSVHAQAPESELPPEPGRFEGAVPTPPPGGFLVPDLPGTVYRDTAIDTRGFTIRPGLVILYDYTGVSQDAASIAQVGEQRDQGQLRASRLLVRGTIGTDYAVRYLIAGEYKGFDSTRNTNWDMTDVSLTFPLRGPATTLTVGKTKQTHAYEMVGDAANLAFQERVLSPFFVSRAVGLRLNHVTADRMSTLAFGVYNDSWAGSSDVPNDGTDVTARATRLLWFEDDGRRMLHVGLSLRRAGADGGRLRYRGRPESNVLAYYVDTGSFAADHGTHVGLEAIWADGPFSVMAEYISASVDAPASGNPRFRGGYVGGSWMVTGGHRPYDPSAGYARRVIPSNPTGALELVARVSRVDLDSGAIAGGVMTKTYLGANWWATHRWKFGAGWSYTRLDEAGTRGVTQAVLLRTQWVY